MIYDHFEHRHRFAAWAAGRASSRGVKAATSKALTSALAQCGVKEFLSDPENYQNLNAKSFQEFHKVWCSKVVKCLKDESSVEYKYGRAAKLIAIYIKSMAVNGPDFESSLASHAHPPIDRYLLNGIVKTAKGVSDDQKKRWAKITWTQLDEGPYYALTDELRKLPEASPFWSLERFWPDERL